MPQFGLQEKLITYTYSMLKFVEWHAHHINKNEHQYVEKNSINLLKTKIGAAFHFGDYNNFNINKLNLITHVLCTSNKACREDMFKIFKNFKISPIGYVENDIDQLLKKSVPVENYLEANNRQPTNPFNVFFALRNSTENLILRGTDANRVFDQNYPDDTDKPTYDYVMLNEEKFETILTDKLPNQHIEESLKKLNDFQYKTKINQTFKVLKFGDILNDGGMLTATDVELSRWNRHHKAYKEFIENMSVNEINQPEIDVNLLIKESSYTMEW